MKILVLASDIPVTSSMPGSSRLFNLCRELARSHTLNLACFPRSRGRERQFKSESKQYEVFSSVEFLDYPAPNPSWCRKQLHRFMLEAFLSTRIRTPDYWNRILSKVENLISTLSADILYVDTHEMVQYIPQNQKVPIVVDLCDSLTFLFRQKADMALNTKRKLALLLESLSIRRIEHLSAKRSEFVIMISEADKDKLLAFAPAAKVLVVPLGVDSDFFSPQSVHKSKDLIFTGVMSYGPNEDAVLYFVKEIFPIIRKVHPDIRFWVVGKNPSTKIRSLQSQQGVEITGTVDDVRPYIEKCGIFVCPLRYGTGVKNKLLLAFSMKIPTVATPISLSGLAAKPGKHVIQAQRPEEFANAVVSLLKNPALANDLSSEARKLVIQHYSWGAVSKPLIDALSKLASGQELH